MEAMILPYSAGTTLRPLFEDTPVESEQALRALSEIHATDERAILHRNIEELVQTGEDIARVIIISDLQATSLDQVANRAALPIATVIDVGEEIRSNSALIEVRSEPPVHLRGRPTRLRIVAQHWGESEEPQRAPVAVDLPEGEIGASIELVDGQESFTSVQFTPVIAGPLMVPLSLPRDRMPADDRRCFATLVRDRLRVGIVGDRDSARFVRAALSPYPPGDARSIVELISIDTPGDLPTRRLDAIVVTSPGAVDDALAEALATAGERGTGILMYAAEPPGEAITEALGMSGGIRFGASRSPEEGASIAVMETARPPLAAFAEPGAGDLTAVRFREMPDLQVDARGPVAVLARFDDGTPVMMESAMGTGRTLLFATSPDDSFSDLVRRPEFVPLTHRLVTYIAAGTEPAVIPAPPGERVVVELPPHYEVERVIGPDGEQIPYEVADNCLTFIPRRRGGYRITTAEEDVAMLAVNLDPDEADPTRLTHEEARHRFAASATEIVAWDDVREFIVGLGPGERDISTLFAFIALLVLAVEAVQSLQPDGSTKKDE